MKFAIIADIHANLDAFQVVLADIKEQKCTHYACVGDVVGYGPNPRECLKIVRDLGMPCVKGNHDEYCSIDEILEGFNAPAAEAVSWTRKQLSEDERQWLRDLKYFRLVTSFSMVHATLDGPQRWGYVFDKLAAAASFTYQNTLGLLLRAYPCAGRIHPGHHGARRDLLEIQGRPDQKILRERRQCRPAPRQQSQGRLRRL